MIVLFIIILKNRLTKDSGLYINLSGLKLKYGKNVDLIYWKEIRSFHSFDSFNQKFIAINLHDNDRFLENKSSYRKRIGRFAIKKFGTPISIPINMFQTSQSELLEYLNECLQRFG